MNKKIIKQMVAIMFAGAVIFTVVEKMILVQPKIPQFDSIAGEMKQR